MFDKMSESSEQPAAPSSRRRRARRQPWYKRLWKALPKPAWAATILGFAQEYFAGFRWLRRLFEYGEHAQFAHDVIVAAGITMPLLVSIASSPLFGAALITLGISYGVFVPENKKFSNRLPYASVAWVVVAFSAIVLVSGFTIRNFIEQPQIINIALSHQVASRHLSPETVTKFTDAAKNIDIATKSMGFVLGSSFDNDSATYANEICKMAKSANFAVYCGATGTYGPENFGVLFFLVDPKNPSKQAASFKECLDQAQIPYTVITWSKDKDFGVPADFSIMVVPGGK